jgi:hypothetical protein
MGTTSYIGIPTPFHSIRLPDKYDDWSFDKNRKR